MSSVFDTFFSPFRQTVDHFWNMPVTNWNRFFNPQFVLNYQDIGVEGHVLSRVGSYGSQLSTLIDTIAILRKNLPADLDKEQTETIAEFDQLYQSSKNAVAEYRGDAASVDAMMAQIVTMKANNPQQYADLLNKIEQLDE